MNGAKRLVLALPAVLLLASADRLGLAPEPAPLPAAPVADWEEAAPLLPARNDGRFGRPGDPLNLVFVGTPRAVRDALAAAGWTQVPVVMRDALIAGLLPMNDYRLRGRRQDMNWELPVTPLARRHHFRLWDSGLRDPAGRAYWWGTGNFDTAIRWRDLSHVPDPDMDYERDFIAGTLASSPFLESSAAVPLPQIPRAGANDKGYPFRDDGRAARIVLKTAPR